MWVDLVLQTNKLTARTERGGGSVPTMHYILPGVHMLPRRRRGRTQNVRCKTSKAVRLDEKYALFGGGAGGQMLTRGGGSSLNDKQLFPSAEEQITDGEEWQQKWEDDALEMKIDTRFCEVSLDT